MKQEEQNDSHINKNDSQWGNTADTPRIGGGICSL